MVPIVDLGLEAKPVSLNDLIAAEEQATQHTTTISTKPRSLTGSSLTHQLTKQSPLKYRQIFQIKTPSKPKRIKLFQKPRNKGKRFTTKRETNHHDEIIQKYIPLLKNVRLFVNNILGSESSETYESRGQKFKRNDYTTNERDDTVCTCERKSNKQFISHSQQETSTTPALSTEIKDEDFTFTIATTTPTHTTVNDNLRSFGRYKDVPALSTRNPTGVRRNHNGFGQRGGSSSYGSFEGYISGDNGNNERNTSGETESHTENYEEYTDSYTRDDADRDRSSEQLRRHEIDSRNSELNGRTNEKVDKFISTRHKTIEAVRKNLSEHEGEVEYKIRGNKTKSTVFVPEFTSRLRGFDSQEEVALLRITNDEEILTQNSASNKRIFDRDGSFTSENQKISAANTAIAPKHILPNSTFPVDKVVVIFDGYSVAKDVNGNNKLSEKAIHIHA